ncbi:hypothetical protein FOMA001_g2309 [Fusarium oxysporum f. sp. matthiolae]|nr:hypothetical protein FOMA001_g2309 [Fusarium oxysporum f. sp. matthiolae]
MVLVVGTTVGAVATNPGMNRLLGSAGAKAAATAFIPTIGAAAAVEGVAVGSGIGGTLLALGEGAWVGVGVLATGGSGSAGIALATAVGPLGWAIVGCSKNNCHNSDSSYTWDCWKPVVRDTSTQPSHGMALRDLATHQNVQSMSLDQEGLLVDNIFGERFHLTPVSVEGTLAFHASIVVS